MLDFFWGGRLIPEEEIMRQYECDLSINGRRTKEIVFARNQIDAKKLVESKYPGAKITWWGSPKQI